jgi:hypothetical protein
LIKEDLFKQQQTTNKTTKQETRKNMSKRKISSTEESKNDDTQNGNSKEYQQKRKKFMKEFGYTEKDMKDYADEFDGDAFESYLRDKAQEERQNSKSAFRKKRDYSKSLLYRGYIATSTLSYHVRRAPARFSSRMKDPIIKLAFESGDFLGLLNDLGRSVLSEEDRKAIRLVMMKVITDIYNKVNPTKVDEVPKLIMKYEKGYGTPEVHLAEDEEEKQFEPQEGGDYQKVGWYLMMKTLFDKYSISHSDPVFEDAKLFIFIRSALLKQKSTVSSTIKEFLEDLLFFQFLENNEIPPTRNVLDLFSMYPDVFDINFHRIHESTGLSMTPIYLTVYKQYRELSDCLIQRNCNLISVDEDRNNILAIAAKHNCDLMIDHLLKKYFSTSKVDINGINSHGETPFHYAVKTSKMSTIELLLRYGGSVEIKDKQGKTPIECINDLSSLSTEEKEQLKTSILAHPVVKGDVKPEGRGTADNDNVDDESGSDNEE